MLVNPGGPGGSGLALAALGQAVPNHAGDAYDWIGFDPRGVGSSRPALSCIPTYGGFDRPEYDPAKAPNVAATWLAKASKYAAACATRGGDLLDHLTTADAAKDMDSIRKALGAKQINYYGFSYGTYLGQVYATLFPQNLRRVVFDGVVDPRGVWYQDNLGQDVAFQKTIEIYFDWVAKHDSTYHLGNTGQAVEKLYYSEQDKLRAHPAGGQIGPSEWTDIFLQAGYYVFGWADTTAMFSDWVHHQNLAELKAPSSTRVPCPTTTDTRSTCPSSAPTRSGPGACRASSPTTPASHARRRSRPGATPGTTRRARTGRPRPPCRCRSAGGACRRS